MQTGSKQDKMNATKAVFQCFLTYFHFIKSEKNNYNTWTYFMICQSESEFFVSICVEILNQRALLDRSLLPKCHLLLSSKSLFKCHLFCGCKVCWVCFKFVFLLEIILSIIYSKFRFRLTNHEICSSTSFFQIL